MKKKNKWLIGIGVVVVLGFMFSDSEEEVQPKEKAEPKTEQVETKPRNKAAENPRDKAAEKPKEKTAEEKAAEEKAAAEAKRLAENQAYRDALKKPLEIVQKEMGTISTQMYALSDNLSLRFDSEWITTTVISLAHIENAANDLKAIQPTNDKTKAIQNLMVQIADHYKYAVANYPAAIDNLDMDLMESITEEIRKSNGKMEEAGLLITTLDNPIE